MFCPKNLICWWWLSWKHAEIWIISMLSKIYWLWFDKYVIELIQHVGMECSVKLCKRVTNASHVTSWKTVLVVNVTVANVKFINAQQAKIIHIYIYVYMKTSRWSCVSALQQYGAIELATTLFLSLDYIHIVPHNFPHTFSSSCSDLDAVSIVSTGGRKESRHFT